MKKNQWQIHEGHAMTFTLDTLKEGLKHSTAALKALGELTHRGEYKKATTLRLTVE